MTNSANIRDAHLKINGRANFYNGNSTLRTHGGGSCACSTKHQRQSSVSVAGGARRRLRVAAIEPVSLLLIQKHRIGLAVDLERVLLLVEDHAELGVGRTVGREHLAARAERRWPHDRERVGD